MVHNLCYKFYKINWAEDVREVVKDKKLYKDKNDKIDLISLKYTRFR